MPARSSSGAAGRRSAGASPSRDHPDHHDAAAGLGLGGALSPGPPQRQARARASSSGSHQRTGGAGRDDAAARVRRPSPPRGRADPAVQQALPVQPAQAVPVPDERPETGRLIAQANVGARRNACWRAPHHLSTMRHAFFLSHVKEDGDLAGRIANAGDNKLASLGWTDYKVRSRCLNPVLHLSKYT